MKVAALDLGSNTFLLLVAEVENGRITQVYQDELRVTRLGQGVNANRAFHPEALQRAEECLREYSEIIESERPERILAMATSAARDVRNAEKLFDLGKQYGIPIEIIPGEREAEITFFGACSERADQNTCAVIDVGGGSTEIVYLGANSLVTGKSLDVGSVRLTEMFVSSHPVMPKEIQRIAEYVRSKISESGFSEKISGVQNLICVAGTPTTLAAVIQKVAYSSDLVHGFRMRLQDLETWRDKLATMDLETRRSLPGMDPKRADVIVAGATILLETAKLFEVTEITVSDRGVRYGIALYMEKL